MKYSELLCCPECKGALEMKSTAFNCRKCRKDFPIFSDVTDFYPEYTGGKVRNQKYMESEKIIAIYESDKWRAGKTFTRGAGIGLQDEINLVLKITSPAPDSTILDLSCGPGLYARTFARNAPGRRVIGYDLSRPMLKWAVEKAKSETLTNIQFLHGDAHRLPFKNSMFDIVNCTGALHNYTDVKKVLREVNRVLKPGGHLSLAVALRKAKLSHALYAWFYDHFFKTHMFREEELRQLLTEAGFTTTVYHAPTLWMIAGAVKL